MIWLLAACAAPASNVVDSSGAPAESSPQAVASWTLLVYMDGDNDLESYVLHDMDELEALGTQAGLTVLVQVDRIEGYDDGDGDWTTTRRYRILPDGADGVPRSELVADLGELDMGDPATLADFLAWGIETAPADHTALVLWDHGDGWSMAPTAPSPAYMVASDDTSGSDLSIAGGELAAGLAAAVEAGGRLDLIAFDACNMGSWEVATALAPYADWMVAAETWVGGEGLQYAAAEASMLAGEAPAVVAVEMARSAVEEGDELSFGAIDLGRMGEVAAAVDALAGRILDDPDLLERTIGWRDEAQEADGDWRNWYRDLRDFAAVVEADPEAGLADPAGTLRDEVDGAMAGNYTSGRYKGLGGLSVYFDLRSQEALDLYADGEGATWAEETRWDELLGALAKLQ